MTGAHGILIAQPSRAGPRFASRSIARRRIARTMLGYVGVLTLAIVVIHVSRRPGVEALFLGIAFPGAGFLAWTTPEGSACGLALALCAGSAALFLAALVLWFATGNVVLPGLVWIGAAVAASGLVAPWPATPLPPFLVAWFPSALLAGLVGAAGLATLTAHRGAAWRVRIAKDAAAGAVLLVSIGAAAIGLLTFWPYVASVTAATGGTSAFGSLICLAPPNG
jgi:hypothetical protein